MKICSDPEFYYVERKKWALKMQMRQESGRTVKFSSINLAQFSNYNRNKLVLVGHGMGRQMIDIMLWV